MAQILGFLHPTWETQTEFQTPGFGPYQPLLLLALGEKISGYVSVPISVSVALPSK